MPVFLRRLTPPRPEPIRSRARRGTLRAADLLKASPKKARKVKHAQTTLEALAASIKAERVLQPPVLEIERGEDGVPTGAYLVTIGEGRCQALRMLVKRKAIKRNHLIRVTVDTENDAHEISLDENVTREAMQSRPQFGVIESSCEGFESLGLRKEIFDRGHRHPSHTYRGSHGDPWSAGRR